MQLFQSKASKKLLKKLKVFFSSSFFFVFIGCAIFSFGLINYYRLRILSFTGEVKTSQEVSKDNKEEVRDNPVRVIIPSIDIDMPLDGAIIKDGVWTISYKNASYLLSSSYPGRGGNIVIYGHNKQVIFGNLPYLSVGQDIILKTESGKEYTYTVYDKQFVNPKRVDLVSNTDHEELTLFTCYGLFDGQRVVVKALPKG